MRLVLKINIWSFIWTTGLGILPFTIAMSGLYAGVRNGSFLWGAIGIAIFIGLLGLSLLIKDGGDESPIGYDR